MPYLNCLIDNSFVNVCKGNLLSKEFDIDRCQWLAIWQGLPFINLQETENKSNIRISMSSKTYMWKYLREN